MKRNNLLENFLTEIRNECHLIEQYTNINPDTFRVKKCIIQRYKKHKILICEYFIHIDITDYNNPVIDRIFFTFINPLTHEEIQIEYTETFDPFDIELTNCDKVLSLDKTVWKNGIKIFDDILIVKDNTLYTS